MKKLILVVAMCGLVPIAQADSRTAGSARFNRGDTATQVKVRVGGAEWRSGRPPVEQPIDPWANRRRPEPQQPVVQHNRHHHDPHWNLSYRYPRSNWYFYYDLTPQTTTRETIIYTTPAVQSNTTYITPTYEAMSSSAITPLERSLVDQWAARNPALYNWADDRDLSRGWQNSLQPGRVLSADVLAKAQALPVLLAQQMPAAPQGTLLVTLHGKLMRILMRDALVLDVSSLP